MQLLPTEDELREQQALNEGESTETAVAPLQATRGAMPTIPVRQPMPQLYPDIDEQYLNRQYMNPRRSFWAGFLTDMGNMMGSWNGSGFQRGLAGTGFKWANQARQNNRQQMRDAFNQHDRNYARQLQQHQLQMQQWQAGQPKYQTMGNQLLSIDPVTGQTTVAHQGATKPQLFGSDNVGYYAYQDGQLQPLVGPGAGGLNQKDRIATSNTLRDDYSAAIKPYIPVADGYQRVQKLADIYTTKGSTKADLQAADNSLMFQVLKARDPASTVTAGEIATTATAPGIGGQLMTLYNRTVSGTPLTDAQRRALIKEIQVAGEQAIGAIGEAGQVYTDRANREGVNPQDVVRQYDYGTSDTLQQFVLPPSHPDSTFNQIDIQVPGLDFNKY